MVGVLPFLAVGLLAAVPMFLLPMTDDLLLASTLHLSAVVLLGLAAAVVLAPLADDTWFAGTGLGRLMRSLASAAGVVALVTGMVALVTLATSAALRFQPSLQFLQLLSALDIAWAAAAIVIGAYRWRGRAMAVVAGLLTGTVCIWSIWRYLDQVGFAEDGGWLLDGAELMRLVIPVDMVAGVVAIAVLVAGSRSRYRMEQPRPQS